MKYSYNNVTNLVNHFKCAPSLAKWSFKVPLKGWKKQYFFLLQNVHSLLPFSAFFFVVTNSSRVLYSYFSDYFLLFIRNEMRDLVCCNRLIDLNILIRLLIIFIIIVDATITSKNNISRKRLHNYCSMIFWVTVKFLNFLITHFSSSCQFKFQLDEIKGQLISVRIYVRLPNSRWSCNYERCNVNVCVSLLSTY